MRRTVIPFHLLLLLSFILPQSDAFCTETEEKWHECTNIRDPNKLENALNIYLDSDATIKKLSIKNCSMSVISSAFFSSAYFSRVTDLTIFNSNVEYIDIGSFSKLTDLQHLNFSGNRILQFNGKVLEGLNTLKSLTLIDNNIKMIKSLCSVAGNLKDIYFEGSDLEMSEVSEDAFENCLKVENLTMIGKGIKSFHVDFHKQLPKLKMLNLSKNNLSDISFLASNTSHEIVSLDISSNQIKTIDADLFKVALKFVNDINLNNNQIENIVYNSSEIFTHENLSRLSLNSNNIAVMNKDYFKYFGQLDYLDINSNPLVIIENDVFSNLKNLKILNIKHSLTKINKISQGMLTGLTSLKELDLSSVSISSIELNAFKDLKKLETLNLSNNKITELHNGTFTGLTFLQTINLEMNNISTLDPGSFFGLNKISHINPQSFFFGVKSLKTRHFEGLSYNYLEDLDLSSLEIKSLEEQTFKGLFGLHHLHLNETKIEYLEANTFVGLEYLYSLNLSNTKLSSLHKEAFNGLRRINNLDLSRSEINDLHHDTFIDLLQLYTLDLSGNKLTTINQGMFRRSHALRDLNLSNNMISILQSQSFIGLNRIASLKLSGNPIIDIEPGAFIGLSYYSTVLTSIGVATIFKSKTIHSDNFIGLNKLQNMNLSNVGIESLESEAFKGIEFLKELHLENNKISILPNAGFAGPEWIEYLDLSNNNLTEITIEMFTDASIVNLRLERNHFEQLNVSAFCILEDLQELYLNNASILSIVNNNCSLYELVILELKDNFISNLESNYFSGMHNLSTLDLSNNPINVIHDNVFASLNNLEILILSGMNLKTLGENSFNGLVKLNNLRIHNSIIDMIDNRVFSPTAVSYLNISNNIIKQILPDAFNGLNLTILDLSNNTLNNRIQPMLFQNLTNLRNLHLSNNKLTKLLSCSLFSDLYNLKSLHLDNNEISEIKVCAFQGLSNVTTLNLFANNITFFSAGTFSSFTSLKNLNISYNCLVDMSSYNLQNLKEVDTLDFSFNKLSLNSELFMSMHKLKHVAIGENSWTCDNLNDVFNCFYSKGIRVLFNYGLRYDVNNIQGIRCS